MTENLSLLVKGLTQEHKDFLQDYALKNLGSRSRTKAVIAIIDEVMHQDSDLSEQLDELSNQAIKDKKEYILNHQKQIQDKNEKLAQAKKYKDRDMIKKLNETNIKIEKKRIQLSIPIYDYQLLEKLSKINDSSIQYYITYVLYKHLYKERKLLGNEIEVLKKSNYELYKIGVNVNQIAKANNAGDMIELPINQLYNQIQKHIKVVQDLLKSSTDIY